MTTPSAPSYLPTRSAVGCSVGFADPLSCLLITVAVPLSPLQTEKDTLLREELEEVSRNHPGKVHLWFTLDKPPQGEAALFHSSNTSSLFNQTLTFSHFSALLQSAICASITLKQEPDPKAPSSGREKPWPGPGSCLRPLLPVDSLGRKEEGNIGSYSLLSLRFRAIIGGVSGQGGAGN